MQRGRAYSRGTNPWKITPSPLKAIERWVESLPVALKNPVGEPYSGTDPKRLWLLRSRPDQVHRRTMRRGPPTGILAELRFACLQPSGWRAPGGRYVAPSPALPPRGREGWLCFACHFWLASLCLFGLLRFAFLACCALPFWLAALCLFRLLRSLLCCLRLISCGAILRSASLNGAPMTQVGWSARCRSQEAPHPARATYQTTVNAWQLLA